MVVQDRTTKDYVCIPRRNFISKNPRVYYVLMKFKIDYVAYEHVL